MATNPDPRIKAYLEKNREWVSSAEWEKPITFLEMQKGGRAREDGTVVVVTCTDPRINPNIFLGMSPRSGTQATIVRTAGGRVSPALSTLLNLQAVGNAGKKGLIMVVHHTDCGLQSVEDDEEVRDVLEESVVGGEGKEVLEGMAFGVYAHPEESVKEDVEILRKSAFFRGMQIWGGVLDTHTGVVGEVVGV